MFAGAPSSQLYRTIIVHPVSARLHSSNPLLVSRFRFSKVLGLTLETS